MRIWRSIVALFEKPVGIQVENRRTQAYQAVFQGNPSREDQEIVLADLKAFSGFGQVMSPDVSPNELLYREGMRATYSRIFAYLTLAPSDMEALNVAARREAVAMSIQ